MEAKLFAASTNMHFHGMHIAPTCHQDDVLSTLVEPNRGWYEYRFHIPKDQPPGLYWYHPHPHGFSEAQVLGGASGALIVESMGAPIRERRGLSSGCWCCAIRSCRGWRTRAKTPARRAM